MRLMVDLELVRLYRKLKALEKKNRRQSAELAKLFRERAELALRKRSRTK